MKLVSVTGAAIGFCFVFAHLVARGPVANEAEAVMPAAARASFAFPELSEINSCSEKVFVNREYWIPELVDFSAFDDPLDYIQRFYFDPPEVNLTDVHSLVVKPEKMALSKFFDVEFHSKEFIYTARFEADKILLLKAIKNEPREITGTLKEYDSEKAVTFFLTEELRSDHLIAAGKNTIVIPIRPDAISVLSNVRPLTPEVFALYAENRPVFEFGVREMQ